MQSIRMDKIIYLVRSYKIRLHIRTINNYSYYLIIKDYTNINGKRLTKIFKNWETNIKLKIDLVRIIKFKKLKNILIN